MTSLATTTSEPRISEDVNVVIVQKGSEPESRTQSLRVQRCVASGLGAAGQQRNGKSWSNYKPEKVSKSAEMSGTPRKHELSRTLTINSAGSLFSH